MNRFLFAALLALSLLFISCDIEGPINPTEGEGLRPDVAELLDALGGLDNLKGLNTGRLIDEEMGNCPFNELDIPGEGAYAQGSIGGLAVAPYPDGSTPDTVDSVAHKIYRLASPSLKERSAILVVDDFNDVYFLDPGVFDSLRGLPEDLHERAEQQERRLDVLEAGGQLSHGALVFDHTLALLNELSSDLAVEPLGVDFNGIRADFSDLGITVAAVDTENFNTEIIAERIEATFDVLAKMGYSRFAVNLSFGLVPCSVLEDFEASKEQYRWFGDYRDAVLKANNLDAKKFGEQLAALLTMTVGTDPLRDLAQTDPESFGDVEAIAYLAAAGNYGWDWSLYPGYWPEFASVSAADLSGPANRKDKYYSNTGEVLLPGGYFLLTLYDPNANTWWPPRVDTSIAGTSFAAPALSVFTALDYTNITPQCPFVSYRGTPLAFYDTDALNRAVPALNETLKKAIKDYC